MSFTVFVVKEERTCTCRRDEHTDTCPRWRSEPVNQLYGFIDVDGAAAYVRNILLEDYFLGFEAFEEAKAELAAVDPDGVRVSPADGIVLAIVPTPAETLAQALDTYAAVTDAELEHLLALWNERCAQGGEPR